MKRPMKNHKLRDTPSRRFPGLILSQPHLNACSCVARESVVSRVQIKLAICCEFSAMHPLPDSDSHKIRHMHGHMTSENDAEYIGKETRSLVKQLELSVSTNRSQGHPFEIHVTGIQPGGEVDRFLTHVWKGKGKVEQNPWGLVIHKEPLLDLFPPSSLIFLSPDAPDPLPMDEPLQSFIYCIGGLIDRSVQKGVTLGWANARQVKAYRLPVQEAKSRGLEMGAGTSRSPVLNVSDVVSALAIYQEKLDWVTALDISIPKRKRKAT